MVNLVFLSKGDSQNRLCGWLQMLSGLVWTMLAQNQPMVVLRYTDPLRE